MTKKMLQANRDQIKLGLSLWGTAVTCNKYCGNNEKISIFFNPLTFGKSKNLDHLFLNHSILRLFFGYLFTVLPHIGLIGNLRNFYYN